MTDVLFIHSPNLHEAHRTFAEALYSPSGRKAHGENCFAEAIEADFEGAYHGEMGVFRRFFEAFRRAKEYPDYPVYLFEGGMPMFPVYIMKRKRKEVKERIRNVQRGIEYIKRDLRH